MIQPERKNKKDEAEKMAQKRKRERAGNKA